MRILLLIYMALVGPWSLDVDGTLLQPSFGPAEDAAMSQLIAEAMGDDEIASYRAGSPEARAAFLDSRWKSHSPLFHKYYVGYHLGDRLFTVSPAYFERDGLISRRYISGFSAPHHDDIGTAEHLVRSLLEKLPDDPVVLTALGYLLLERDEIEEADKHFTNAIRKNRKLVEARNGRALACVKMHHRKSRALELFRETLALERTYIGALYGMGMCHIAMVGQDRVGVDEYFGKIIEADPSHPDAHFKLGAFNESLRRMDRAAEAYSRQLTVNPSHKRASERLAHVGMLLDGAEERPFTFSELRDLADDRPETYLPLLAEAHIERREFARAEEAFEQYLSTLPAEKQFFYQDLSLIADDKTLKAIEEAYPREERDRLIRRFWLIKDPTPTTPANERRLEHYRRVFHALGSYSDGIDRLSLGGWDRRGDVYVRFGKPDHQSWSDFLVFETDSSVTRVKNRINHLAHDAIEEVLPPRQLQRNAFSPAGLVSTDIRGIPTFPLPRRTTQFTDGVETGYVWESWIYGQVGGGIEVTFIDEIGKGYYEFAQVPPGSPNHLLWRSLAPETIVEKIVSKTPSTYNHDYGGEPIDLYVSSAGFRGEDGRTDYEVYLGVPAGDVAIEESATVELVKEIAFYDMNSRLVHRETDRISHRIVGNNTNVLLIDQIDTPLRSGPYLLAAQVTHPQTGNLQVYRTPVNVLSFVQSELNVSDIELAARVSDRAAASKWSKGTLEVVPLPTKAVLAGSPVHLYFELYGLSRDEFGKTRYRVDYEVASEGDVSIISRIGRMIGRESGKQSVRVSYEHVGDTVDEGIHVSLTIPPSVEKGRVRVTVHVSDLLAKDSKPVERSAQLYVIN